MQSAVIRASSLLVAFVGKAGLHLAGKFHFLSDAAIRLHSLRHLFCETYVLQGDAGMGRY